MFRRRFRVSLVLAIPVVLFSHIVAEPLGYTNPATGYNIIAVPLAGGVLAFAGVAISPAVAAILMSVSTSIRVRRVRRRIRWG